MGVSEATSISTGGHELTILPTPPGRRRASAALWWLRLAAWRRQRLQAGDHPVTDLVARGDWAALDRLLLDLETEPLVGQSPARPAPAGRSRTSRPAD